MRPTGAIAALACALAASAAARAADVDVELVLMGVGGHVRPGDPTAILVRATSSLTAPVQARIEWSVRNADGDTVRFTRDAALAPGAPVERWVYGVMPIVTTSAQGCLDAVSAVRVVEVEASGASTARRARRRRRRSRRSRRWSVSSATAARGCRPWRRPPRTCRCRRP
jgi:hypothetical protein